MILGDIFIFIISVRFVSRLKAVDCGIYSIKNKPRYFCCMDYQNYDMIYL